uniref:Uncharacterized protein n=1 Tax=Mycena chlorophos TaxID=658473 RepID=A0ABQ0LHZ0_MYCCL|nr:predicted protein [Mycena chlorophos]
MASILSILCCCCGHGRSAAHDADEVNENSRLIPSNVDASPPNIEYTDQQRMEERLLSIVRTKERKMVNVISQIPFNLHGRVITPNPSLSRSVSLSTGRPEPPHSHIDVREPLTVQLARPIHSRNASGSQSNDSHPSSRDVSLARERVLQPPREPILNARLVTPLAAGVVPPRERVGRPRRRATSVSSSRETGTGTETLSSTSSAIGPSPPDVRPLDEICWSWGDEGVLSTSPKP